MSDVMTTFEDFHDKLGMVREIGALLSYTEYHHHLGAFIVETMIEFREAMYQADKDSNAEPSGKEASDA
jgi:hypothetical protein